MAYRHFRPILTKAKLPRIRLSDLRRIGPTLLMIAAKNPTVIGERVGHSIIVLTPDT